MATDTVMATAPTLDAGPDLEELDCLISKASAVAVLISGDRSVCKVHQNAAWLITDVLAQALAMIRPTTGETEARHG